jgi:ArsR family transcriptional regulator
LAAPQGKKVARMASQGDAGLLEDMTVLADAVRSRLLLLLEAQELTVGQLGAILQLPQSTVSRHMKALADRNWIASRAIGTQRPYAATLDDVAEVSRRLWELTRQEVARTKAAVGDQGRLVTVLAQHRSRSQQFFANEGESWDALRTEQFGKAFHLQSMLALLDPHITFGDLGCGTGPLVEAVAPYVGMVIGVDASPTMLRLARQRLQAFEHVDLRRGQLEALPIDDGALDVATLMLVLHHLQEPERAIAEAARCIKPGGSLLIVDMLPHDRVHYRQEMGHVWLGFAEDSLRDSLAAAGFADVRLRALPPDPEGRGPNLFALAATRVEPVATVAA